MNPKEKKRKDLLAKVKSAIRLQAHDDNKYYCWGCGKGGVGLDCSHILSVAQRKDLECDPENINLFCRECHIKWESGEEEKRKELLTYDKDMEYIELKRKIHPPKFDHEANKTVKRHITPP